MNDMHMDSYICTHQGGTICLQQAFSFAEQNGTMSTLCQMTGNSM